MANINDILANSNVAALSDNARLIEAQEERLRVIEASEQRQRVIDAHDQRLRVSRMHEGLLRLNGNDNLARVRLSSENSIASILSSSNAFVDRLRLSTERIVFAANHFESPLKLRPTIAESLRATDPLMLTRADALGNSIHNLAASVSLHSAGVKFADTNALVQRFDSIKQTVLGSSVIQSMVSEALTVRPSLGTVVGPMSSSVSALSISASRVWEQLGDSRVSLVTSPWLWEAPAVQPYQAARSTALIAAAEEDTDLEIEEPEYLIEDGVIDVGLSRYGDEYVSALAGARDALRGKNPDRVRHASTSFRELLDKLIVAMVPETDVRSWTEGAQLLKDGQVRKAHLKTLFNRLDLGEYSTFAEKDVEGILATFYALNKGTHALRSPYNDKAMAILRARIEGHLLLLLAAADLGGEA